MNFKNLIAMILYNKITKIKHVRHFSETYNIFMHRTQVLCMIVDSYKGMYLEFKRLNIKLYCNKEYLRREIKVL